MNCNLHEPTYKCPQSCQRSNQLHCLIICMSFCVWFVSRIQWLQYVCRPINFPKAINGRESWGGYSIIMYFLLFPRLLRSRLHAMRRQHTQKSYVCTWISPSYLFSWHLQILLLHHQTKPNPCIATKIWASRKIWRALNPDNLNWHSFKFVHWRFLKFIKTSDKN